MKNIFVIGLGLIGGSIALAIKKAHPTCRIIGYDIHEKQRKMARVLNVVNEATDDMRYGAEQADFIIISTPVQQTLTVLNSLREIQLKKNIIITDVGSTKQKIVEHALEVLPKDVTFIGGHPMAGSHKSGVVAAKAHLFENAFYILTPTSNELNNNVESLKHLLKGTNAKFVVMNPNEHDLITGIISHFPHIIAASLVHQAEKNEEQLPLLKRMAAGGFRDITRIASSNPTMWRDILLQNDVVISELFDDWIEEMKRLKEYVLSQKGSDIYTYFEKAKSFRDGLPERQKGAIPSFYDLYVDVPDYPGVISEITGYLAKEQISITNIRIMETREEIYGVLRISFQSERDRERAKQCIQNYSSYETFIDE
ncbi:prephenate dehydrogenase [Bacillus sp. FJAT-47783]|uniref:prephenate dehydrogenase n=1 Tax=Bacillus sp. FJAT-47783 TaxID=2922712 RepID=UPI001FACC920|nr:prephenate dehydrogenase [Bacillus sp. FJAT-47783]